MKWFKLFMVLSIALILTACGSAKDVAEEGSESKEEASSEEGEQVVEFYTSQPDEDASKLVEAFNEKHPDIKVNTFRSGTEEVIGKLNAEKKAGEIKADVLLVADSVTFEQLNEDELLMSYESEEAGELAEKFIGTDNTYYGTKVMATAIAYNTDNVKEAPKSWSDLTEDDAKDKVIMPSPLYSGAAAYNAGVISRNDLGWEFYEKLKENNATVVKGNGGALQEIQSGNKDYAMVVDFIVARANQEGSPVELVYPEEGVPVITEPIGIMKDAKNPEAAKKFVDFVLSEDGQKLAAEIGYTPIRKGVDAPEGLKTVDEMDIIDADIKELVKSREDDKNKFKDIFGE